MDSKDTGDFGIRNPNYISDNSNGSLHRNNSHNEGNNNNQVISRQSATKPVMAQIDDLRRESDATQKKIGPLGLKRLRNGSRITVTSDMTRLSKRASLHRRLSNGKIDSDEDNVDSVQMTDLSLIAEIEEQEENPDTVFPSKQLVKKGGPKSVNELDKNGLAAIHLAAQSGQASLIKDLLNKGADINIQSATDGATPLHIATRCNRVQATEVLLRYDADVIKTLSNGQTALHIACRKGNFKIAMILIKHCQTMVNFFDKDKSTPLHQAAMMGDVNVCELLVEHEADIRARDVNGVTPLMQAAQAGFKDFVQYLLFLASQKSICVQDYLGDTESEGNTALHLAVGNRHVNVARVLIERGASIDARKNNGYTALHQAAVIGEVRMVEMLIDKGAQTELCDAEQMTPLHRASIYNRVDTILLLIRQGLYLNSQDEDNFTPLISAAWKGQAEAGRALLRYGGDIQAQDRQLKTCLHWAVEMEHLDFVKMLFEDGHEGEELLDWEDRNDQTALHYAAEVGNEKLVNLLIEQGAKIDIKDVEERTPLHFASENGCLECVQLLFEACPVPLNDSDIEDLTPLHLASQNGHHKVVKYLLQMGSDIASRNMEHRTALALAAANNHVEVVTYLLDNHADVNAADNNKDTPLHLCASRGHDSTASLLLNSGADVSLKNNHDLYPLDIAIEFKHDTVAEAILSSKSWEVAVNNRDEFGNTPINRLIQYLPDAMLLVMNQCVTASHEDKHHEDLEITYNYKYLDPGPDDPSSVRNGRQYALEAMVRWEQEKLLQHELTQSLLSMKWSKFARFFHYFDLIIYIVFLAITYMYLWDNIEILVHGDWENGCPHQSNNTHGHVHTIETVMDPDGVKRTYYSSRMTIGYQLFITAFIVIKLVREIMEVLITRFRYFMNLENWAHWLLYVAMFLFIYPPYTPPCEDRWPWGAMAIFQTWMNFIFIIQRFDVFGIYVTMFWTTLRSLIKAWVVYIFFILGFALAFRIIFAGKHPSFQDDYHALTTIFTMTLGEINKSDLFDSDINLYPFEYVATVLFVVFLFLMPMVLINLTIGISVGDIESILRSAYLQRFAQQIDNIIDIEIRFPKFMQRKLWVEKKTRYPNKKRSTLLRRFMKVLLGSAESATDFLRPSTGKTKVVTEEEIFAEILRHEEMLQTLSTMMHNQENLLRQQGSLLRDIAHQMESTN